MAPPAHKQGEARLVRTTFELPEELWKRAKLRALDERSDLRTIVMRGMELYLARPVQAKKGGR